NQCDVPLGVERRLEIAVGRDNVDRRCGHLRFLPENPPPTPPRRGEGLVPAGWGGYGVLTSDAVALSKVPCPLIADVIGRSVLAFPKTTSGIPSRTASIPAWTFFFIRPAAASIAASVDSSLETSIWRMRESGSLTSASSPAVLERMMSACALRASASRR